MTMEERTELRRRSRSRTLRAEDVRRAKVLLMMPFIPEKLVQDHWSSYLSSIFSTSSRVIESLIGQLP